MRSAGVEMPFARIQCVGVPSPLGGAHAETQPPRVAASDVMGGDAGAITPSAPTSSEVAARPVAWILMQQIGRMHARARASA